MYANTKMVAEIQKCVKLSPSVAKALGSVDRAFFVPPSLGSRAYSLDPLPLEDSQWISSPLTVAIMSESLLAEGGESVLEVGCGSGYQAMVLSHLFKYVYTIERIEPLLIEAKRRFHLLNAHNIFAKFDDGQNGWIEHAPFDAILFSACAREIPPALIADPRGAQCAGRAADAALFRADAAAHHALCQAKWRFGHAFSDHTMLICQCVQWHRALSHTGGVSVDLGLNLAVLGACCVFVLCGVGFTALCMRRYLHFSIACSSALSSVANLALLALVLSLQPSPFIESIAPNRYQIFHNLLIYLSLSVLFVMAYLDYVYLALPDSVLVVFFVLGCACVASIAMPASFIWAHIRDALALMGGAFALGLFGEIVFKKPVLGEADIIVLGGIGLVFGVFFALVSVFVASCLVLAIAFFLCPHLKGAPSRHCLCELSFCRGAHNLCWGFAYPSVGGTL